MFLLESHLLSSIQHANVLRAVHYNKAEIVAGSADSTMKQSSCSQTGPFAVQKVIQRKVLYIAIELAQEFDLEKYLEYTQGFKELHALQLFLQLLKGIKAIHQSGFADRDIKVSNILIGQDLKLKISDLGLAAPLNGCSCANERHDIRNTECK